MTIAATSTRTTYAGAGLTGPYAYNFRIFSTDDLVVTKRSAAGVETTLPYGAGGWTLTTGVVVGTSSGSITLAVALAVGEVLVIRRAPALAQPTSLQNQSSYFPKAIEDEFDRLAMQIQGVKDRVDRSFALGETFDPAAHSMTLAPVDGQVVGWSGGQLANVTVDPTGVVLPGGGRTVSSLSNYLANNAVFNVKDYGAIGDGVADDTAAFQLCFATVCALVNASIQALGAQIVIPRGTYLITDTIPITVNRLHVRGEGKFASNILFNPAAAKPCFKIQNSNGGDTAQGSIRGIKFGGAGAQQKIAIDAFDISEYVFSEILVASSWTGNSGSGLTPSIGFRISARELVTFQQLDVFADRPFHIRAGSNPLIGADHYCFRDIYFNALVAAEAGILIDDTCIITSWTMEGYQAWIGGTYGVYAKASSSCIGVNIRNVRYEQPAATGGYALRWEAGTKAMVVEGCNFGGAVAPTNGALYIRNVRCFTVIACAYTGSAGATAVALNVDATVDDINLINFFAQNTSLATGLGASFFILSGVPSLDSSAPFPPTASYSRIGSTALRAMRGMGGTYEESIIADVATAATQALALNALAAAVGAIISVVAYSAVGPIQECGDFALTPSSVIKKSGTAGCVTPIGTGNVSVEWYAGPQVLIRNNTAQTLKMLITVTFRL